MKRIGDIMFHSNKQKVFSYIVLVIYFILLSWLVIFKFSINFADVPHMRGLNLIPFHYDTQVSALQHVREVGYNVLVFIPLGVYVYILRKDWKFWQKILVGFCVSLIFETIQYIFAIGASDITDLIGNTGGTIIGILFCSILSKVLKDSYISIMNRLGFIVELMVIVLLGVLTVCNM